MSRFRPAIVAAATLAASVPAHADDPPKIAVAATVLHYAMRDEPDFHVGVASLERGRLRFEARYNYEARDAGSVFVGWKFAGGEQLTWQITPIAGVLFGSTKALIPGLEASVAWRTLDAYVEAEYVSDLEHHADSYFYAWIELGWRPVEWLRVGLVGQRTRVIDNGRDIQRGVFGQLAFGNTTVGVYAFNPEAASRYAIVSLGLSF